MKKALLVLALAIIVAGSVFAQKSDAKNWISGEVSLLGAGARYERMLSSRLSVGANAYWSSLFFFWNELGADVFVRLYPFKGSFFAGVALGYHTHTGTYEYEEKDFGITYKNTWFGAVNGAAITPELGWKFDPGKPGKFYIQPGVKVPITAGMLGAHDGIKSQFKLSFGVVPYLGMGYAF